MKMLILLIALLLAVSAPAQQNSNITLYAFEQPVTPGVQKAGDIDESGNRISAENTGPLRNYMLYAVSPSSARLYPVTLWLKGKKYGVKLKTVTETPVTHTNYSNPGSPKTAVLVPETGKKVLELIPTDVYSEKAFPAAESLAASNDVVFVFRQNGKFLYKTLSRLTKLDAAAMQ
jgi:hypothetical protein